MYDFCIIGGGPIGITIANRLSLNNKKIVLIESGSEKFPTTPYSQSLDYDSKQFKFHDQIMMLGGAGNFWEGRTGTMLDIDFKKKEWLKESGWPINLSELDEFYEEAHNIMKLKNRYSYNSELSDKYLNKKFDKNVLDLLVEDNFFIRGMQYIDLEYKNFYFLINKKFELLLNHKVISLNENNGKITSAKTSFEGISKEIKADIFIMCSGALENTRLLLNSNKLNENKFIGKYFQNHPCGLIGSVKLYKKFQKKFLILDRENSKKDNVEFAINISEATLIKEKILNILFELRHQKVSINEHIFLEENEIDNKKKFLKKIFKLISFKENFFSNIFIIIKGLKIYLKKFYYNLLNIKPYIHFFAKLEDVPDYENELKLENNKIKIKYKYNKKIYDTTIFATNKIVNFFNKHNIGKCELSKYLLNENTIRDCFSNNLGNHPMGTTRISSNLEEGVVDKNLKFNNIDNLYVMGSSIFPTSGNTNPTFTSLALALRFVKFIVNK
tara:strand:+ start:93 stop:1589 length:1497 start_codon:yes stop_codon:yes gene_type:complete